MPNHKSCKKRMRTSEKRNEYNRSVKSTVKTILKKFETAQGAEAETAFREISSQLDRAARKGVLPKSRVDRKKGRLARALNRKTAA